jgi:hypothetical protein
MCLYGCLVPLEALEGVWATTYFSRSVPTFAHVPARVFGPYFDLARLLLQAADFRNMYAISSLLIFALY